MENANRIMMPKLSQSFLNQSKDINNWIKKNGLDKPSNQKKVTNLLKATKEFQIDDSAVKSRLELLARLNRKNNSPDEILQRQLNQSKELIKKVNWNAIQNALGVEHYSNSKNSQFTNNSETLVHSYNVDSPEFSKDLEDLIGIPGYSVTNEQEKNLKETYITINNTEDNVNDTHPYQKIIWNNVWKLHNSKTMLTIGDVNTIVNFVEFITWFIKEISKIWH